MRYIILTSMTLFLSSIMGLTAFADERVIYGDDDRKEIHQADSYWQKMANSTVGLMYASDLEDLGNDTYKIKGKNYGKSYGLCETEAFREQISAAYCSGSLIAPNIIMTAGHCIRTQSACDRTKLIFDYGYKVGGENLETAKASNVYSCKKLIVSKVEGFGADYALVELDRDVVDREPLQVRRDGEVTQGQALTVIGHPAGLPTKIAGGANVRALKKGYFVANLDTYGGNSGSAVINDQTGLIEGILVRGETDFVYSNGCYKSNICANDKCRGEDVTFVSEVVKYLK